MFRGDVILVVLRVVLIGRVVFNVSIVVGMFLECIFGMLLWVWVRVGRLGVGIG